MKVILLERVEGRGALGDVITVKDGYARNFLLPRQKALRANSPVAEVAGMVSRLLTAHHGQDSQG